MLKANEARNLVKTYQDDQYRKTFDTMREFMDTKVNSKVKEAAEAGKSRISIAVPADLFPVDMLIGTLQKLGYETSIYKEEAQTITILWT